MENLDPIDVQFLINSQEVKKEMAEVKKDITEGTDVLEKASTRASRKVKEEMDRATEAVEEFVTETNRAGDQLGKNLPKAGQKAKAQFDGLGNSINQISRELPAFTYSAQTGFMAVSNNIPILVDEINRLRVANAAAAASGAATVPIWTAIRAALFSWMTVISLAITALTVFGPKIFSYIKSLFDTKKALDEAKEAQEAMNEAFKSSDLQGAIEEVIDLKTNVKLAKEGLIDKKTVIDQYNESIGKAATEVKTLDEVERGLIENADKYVQATLYKAAADAAREKIAKEMVEAAQRQFDAEEDLIKAQEKLEQQKAQGVRMSGTGATSNVSNAEQAARNAQFEVDQAKKAMDDLANSGNKLIGKLKQMSLDTGLDLFSEDEDKKKEGTDKAINARQQLLDKIAALDAEYARKSFTKDEEEIQAIRDKFARVRELVERFNNDPKNKANRIDISGLGDLENQAVGDVRFRQETQAMTREIAEQKRIFQEFEAYKATFGEAKAKDRYRDQIGEFETFTDYLRSIIDRNQETYNAVLTGDASGGQTERYKMLEKAAQDENDIQLAKFDKLLQENQTYQDKLQVMTEKYLKARAALMEQGKTDEVAILDKKYKEEVENLEDANIRKTEAYKNLFRNVQRMTIANARALIAAMDEEVKNHKLSADEIAKIEQKKAQLLALINRQSLENIFQITQALGGLGEALRELGDSTGTGGLAQIGSLMSGLASGVNDLLVSFDKDASNIDKITAGINGLIKMIGMLARAARARREAEEEYYRSVIGFQNQYNLSLNEQIRLQSILGESVFLKDFEGRIKDGLSALANANKEYQKALDKLAEGRAKSGLRNAVDWGNVGAGASSGAAVGAAVGSIVPVIGTAVGAVVGAIAGGLAGLFGGMKKKDTLLPLLEAYPELIQESEDGIQRINKELAKNLIQNNLVDAKTKDILENILEWEEALEEARAQIREVVGELAGSLGNDLRNALVEAFKNGEDAAVRMGETVEKVLEDILSQLIFNRIFSDAFKKLEDEMVESSDVGGDGNWIDDFERFFSTAKDLGDDFNKAMTDAMNAAAASGFNVFQPNGSEAQRGLSGAIRRELTEQTGSELAGLFRGFYDISRRSFQLDERWMALEQKHYEATLDMVRSTSAIESNTANTVSELKLAVVELKEIKKNTKSGNGFRDTGLDG